MRRINFLALVTLLFFGCASEKKIKGWVCQANTYRTDGSYYNETLKPSSPECVEKLKSRKQELSYIRTCQDEVSYYEDVMNKWIGCVKISDQEVVSARAKDIDQLFSCQLKNENCKPIPPFNSITFPEDTLGFYNTLNKKVAEYPACISNKYLYKNINNELVKGSCQKEINKYQELLSTWQNKRLKVIEEDARARINSAIGVIKDSLCKVKVDVDINCK